MLYRILQRQRTRRPSQTAVIGERRALTYNRLFAEVRRAIQLLRGLKFRAGDILLVGIPPSPEFYVLFYAAAALGLKTIPLIDSGKAPAHVKRLGPVAAAGSRAWMETLRAEGVTIERTIYWNAAAGLRLPKARSRFVAPKLVRGEEVLGISTSGTTGDPVLHYRTAEVLPRRSRLRAAAWGITAKDTLICAGPFTNGANADFHLILPIVMGCKVAVLEKFHRQKLVRAIARHKVSVICSVPLTFEVLASLPQSPDVDFSSVRRCISNGAVLAKSIYESFRRRYGLGIGQMYGGSHISPVFTFNRGAVPDAVGQRRGPFPVSIVDPRGKKLRPGKIGEIVFELSGIKDKVLRASLLDNPHRQGDLIFSGDLGRFDARDNLFVVGRKSALIKVGGTRVVPAEVEDALRAHPAVREAVVFALRPGTTHEAVAAVVVPDRAVTERDLIEHCAAALDIYKCPKKIFLRRSLPRNQHGKVIRYRLEAAGRKAG